MSLQLMNNPFKIALNPILLTISGISACFLACSYVFELWLGYEPCRLCLIQRHVYTLVFFFTFLGFLAKSKKVFWVISVSVLLAGIATAAYHTLTYFGLIESKCSVTPPLSEDFFLTGYSIPCSEQMITVLGMPGSLINIVSYSACLILLFWGGMNHDRTQHAKNSTPRICNKL